MDELMIVNLYVDGGFSGREISKKTSYALTTIQRVLKKHNVVRGLKEARTNLFQKGYKHSFKKELDEKEIIRLYTKENVSIPQIARIFDCSIGPILRILRENKIPTKSSSESHKGNPGYWKGKRRPGISVAMKGRKFSEEHKENLRKSHLGKKPTIAGKTYDEFYGEKAKYLKEKLRISHLGQVSVQKGKTFEQMYGEERSNEIKRNLARITSDKFKNPIFKQKISQIQKDIWSTPEKKEYALRRRLKQVFPTKNTAPERTLFNELELKGIIFEKHKTLFNKFQPDAVISEKKIAIFVDGDYWHANPIKYKDKVLTKSQFDRVRRDKEQNELLTKEGWTILRFWESEIKKDVKKCIDTVEKTINRRRNNVI